MAISKQSAGHVQATLEVSDIQVGAVELKNAVDDTRAKIDATGSIAEGDNAVAVQAPVLGATTDAEAAGDGTIVALLKRLRTLLAGGLPASLGQKTMAASLPVTIASDQSSTPVAAAATIADGADTAQGTTTDAAASSTVAEDATARTGIGLWKGIKNILILINAWVSALGTTTDAAASSAVAEDATARTSIGLLKGVKNILILINAKLTALGRAAMAASMPVVIATEQMPDDGSAFTPSSDPYMPIGGEYDDAGPAALAEGQGGAVRLSARREMHVTIRDADGNERGMYIDANGDVGIRSYGDSISQTPTVTAGAYAASDAVGGLLTFANAARISGGGGVIKDVIILDDAGQDVEMELWLFAVTFTAMADNAAWNPSQADLRNLIAIISTTDGAWFAAGTESAARIEVSQRYDLTGTSMFGQLVTRGTPTFAATDDVSVVIGLLTD